MKKCISICAIILTVVCLLSLCVNEFKPIAVAATAADSVYADTSATEDGNAGLSKFDRMMNIVIGALGGMLVSGFVLSLFFGIKIIIARAKKRR